MNRGLEFRLLVLIVLAAAIAIGRSLPHPKIPCQLTTLPTGQFHCTGAP